MGRKLGMVRYYHFIYLNGRAVKPNLSQVWHKSNTKVILTDLGGSISIQRHQRWFRKTSQIVSSVAL